MAVSEHDGKLIKEALAGSREAFRSVYDIYSPGLMTAASQAGLGEEETRVVLKDVFRYLAVSLPVIRNADEFVSLMKSRAASDIKSILRSALLPDVSSPDVSSPVSPEENSTVSRSSGVSLPEELFPDDKEDKETSEDDGESVYDKADKAWRKHLDLDSEPPYDEDPEEEETVSSNYRPKSERKGKGKAKGKGKNRIFRIAALVLAAVILLGAAGYGLSLLLGRPSAYELPYTASMKEDYVKYLGILTGQREQILDVSDPADPTEYVPDVCFYDMDSDGSVEMIYLRRNANKRIELIIDTVKSGIVSEVYQAERYDLRCIFVSGDDVYIIIQRGADTVETWIDTLKLENGTVTLNNVLYSVGQYTTVTTDQHEYLYAYYKDGKQCESNEFMKAYKSIVRNIKLSLITLTPPWNQYMEGNGGLTEMLSGGTLPTAAMDCDSAIEKISSLTGTPYPVTTTVATLFSDMPSDFVFTSESGGWRTELRMYSDGSFTGVFTDQDFEPDAATGTDWVVYTCEFRGVFTDTVRIDPYTYSVKMKHLEITGPEEDYTEGKNRYVLSDPYGMTGGTDFMIYLPGAFRGKLTQQLLSWSSWKFSPSEEVTLPCWALYCLQSGDSFFENDPAPPEPVQTVDTVPQEIPGSTETETENEDSGN